MNSFILLIAALCSQTGPGHGDDAVSTGYVRKVSQLIREDAFTAQSACTKRLFKACTTKHLVTGAPVIKGAECLVENL